MTAINLIKEIKNRSAFPVVIDQTYLQMSTNKVNTSAIKNRGYAQLAKESGKFHSQNQIN